MRLFVLAFVLAGTGCSAGREAATPGAATPNGAAPDAGPMMLSVSEFRPQVDVVERPTPTLVLTTDAMFGCGVLDAEAQRAGFTVDLTVHGMGRVDPDRLCNRTSRPATFRVPFDVPAGTYRVRVHSSGETDEFRLTVGDDRFDIETVRSRVTRAPEPLVWRLPEHSFVYSCGTLTGDEALCDQFRARLEEAAVLTPIPVPEAGVWPYPRQAVGHYYDAPSLVYRYASEDDFERIKDALRAFSVDVLRDHTGDGLYVQDWRGDAGRSYLYEQE